MRKTGLYRLLPVLLALLLFSAGCATVSVSPPDALLAEMTGDRHIHLSWEAAPEADFYRVYRIEDAESDYRFLDDVTELTYTDTTAKDGVVYGYKVTALLGNSESVGCVSNKLQLAPKGEDTAVAVPATPVITSVTALDRFTTVIMFDPGSTDCTYRIMRSDAPDGKFTPIGETKDPVYYDTTLSTGESYYYTVTAVTDTVASDSSLPQKTGTNAKTVFGVPVLMYHQFLTPEDVEDGISFGEYAIWQSEFEGDLLFLQRNGYTTITTKELISFMNGETDAPKKPILLTIDDGWRGVYLNAWPLLEKYDMKAVLSVIGNRIDDATFSDSDQRLYCSWEELQEMERSGHMEIISHTATCHDDEDMTKPRRGANCAEGESEESFRLAAIPDYAGISKNFKKYFGYTPYAMAYPYSSRSITSDRVWMSCGYQILFAGNDDDARKSIINYFAAGAGITRDSAILRRVARMHGTSLEAYMRNFY